MVQRRPKSRASRSDIHVRRPWLEALECRELLAATLTPTGVPILAMVGTSVSVTVGSFSDSDMNAMAADFTATITWGDGTMSSMGTVSGASGTFDVAGTHTYMTADSFPISIQVTDSSDGGTTTIYSSASVSTALLTPIPAQITAAVNMPIAAGTTIGSFFDPDPNAKPTDFTAAITWGDGHASVGTVALVPGTSSLFAVAGTNVYTTANMYPITILVQDNSGDMTKIMSTATVSSAALTPIAASVTATKNVPIPASTTIGSFFDSALSTIASAFTAVITWGDGQMSDGTVVAVPNTPGLFDVVGSHTYTIAGNFAIAIQIYGTNGTSSTGATSGTSTQLPMINSTAIVSGAILTAVPSLIAATVNIPIPSSTTIGSFSDSDSTATASDFTAVIDWGDGHTSGGTVTAVMSSPGLFIVQGSNTYATVGNFMISIQVTDTSGDTVTIMSRATVSGTELNVIPALVTATVNTPIPAGTIVGSFFDSESSAKASGFTATIMWGDGHTSAGTVAAAMSTPGLFIVAGTNLYTAANTYQVTIVVKDANDNSAVIMSTVVATGTTLIATGMTFSATLGQPLPTQAIATFTDTSALANQNNIMAVIDWGDGQTTPGTVVSSGPNGLYTVMGSHTYPAVALATSPVTGPPPGIPVAVTITDPSGQTAVANSTALLVNVAPSAAAPVSASPSSSTMSTPPGASHAVGDVLGNGTMDMVVGAPAGSLPIVTIYDSATHAVVTRFLAYSPDYRGGVIVAVGGSNGTGRPAVLTWKVGRHGTRTDRRAFDALTGVAAGHSSGFGSHSDHVQTRKERR